MSSPTFRSWSRPCPVTGEVNTLPSLTVPDQVLSIQELVQRFVRGQDVDVFPAVYSEDMPDVERMDAMERHDLATQMKSELAEHALRIRRSRAEPPPLPPVKEEEVDDSPE